MTHSRVVYSSCEKDLEKFSKFSEKLIILFFQLKAIHDSLVTGWRVQVPVAKNILNFFQNLGLKVFGDSFVSHLGREKHVFCKNRVKS